MIFHLFKQKLALAHNLKKSPGHIDTPKHDIKLEAFNHHNQNHVLHESMAKVSPSASVPCVSKTKCFRIEGGFNTMPQVLYSNKENLPETEFNIKRVISSPEKAEHHSNVLSPLGQNLQGEFSGAGCEGHESGIVVLLFIHKFKCDIF